MWDPWDTYIGLQDKSNICAKSGLKNVSQWAHFVELKQQSLGQHTSNKNDVQVSI